MSSTSNTAVKKDLTKLQRAIIDGLEDVKAQDIQVFDTEHLSPLFERVIVATGTSNRQTKAIASSVRDAVKKAGFATPRHEGEASGEWIIVDCNQAVVHIMQPAIRQYYRLEEIWAKSPCASNWAGPKFPNALLRKMPAKKPRLPPPPKSPACAKRPAPAKPALPAQPQPNPKPAPPNRVRPAPAALAVPARPAAPAPPKKPRRKRP